MKVEIDFEIGDQVWFIHPKTMKAHTAILKGLRADIEDGFVNKIKYQLDVPALKNEEKFFVWAIFKTKEDLLKSL